jgi:single-stranded DNA-binding protein
MLERIKKGTQVYVTGDLEVSKYADETSGKMLPSVRVTQSTIASRVEGGLTVESVEVLKAPRTREEPIEEEGEEEMVSGRA